MHTRRLGASGPTVSTIGLGAMGMSDLYGPADDAESIATIRAALDAGVTLIDTGDFYGMGHNELLIRDALAGRNRDEVTISVKFGVLRGPDGSWLGADARPAAVRTFLAYTLRRLGHRPRRHLPPIPARPGRPCRGHGRRHRRPGPSRLRESHRTLRGGSRRATPRCRRPSDLRPADRVLAALAGDRGRRSFPRRAS